MSTFLVYIQIKNYENQANNLIEVQKQTQNLLDQQQRLALQDKKLLEEYKAEIKELKSLTTQSTPATLSKDVNQPKDIEIDKKKRRWWAFGK
ncbi:TPA_asm: plasmid replication protein [Listeria monocytogenes]|nr:plasmid replication protein [Listeria monocytogenes]HAC2977605.1 plasmid replication protein [Listeria monocytogenes]